MLQNEPIRLLSRGIPPRVLPWDAKPAELEGGAPVSLGAMADHLYRAGLDEEGVGRVLCTMAAVRVRAHLYRREGGASEPETAARLVLPLLEALGWTAPLTALEWKRIDIALFRRLPRTDANLEAVVEVKRLGADCSRAVNQARRYAEWSPDCRRLVVTDGIRYGAYLREQGDFRLHAYLDLFRPLDSYPVVSCLGAAGALQQLSRYR